MTTPTWWLVIVDRNRPDLYAILRRRLGSTAQVILDRRSPSGRVGHQDERRRPMTAADATLWQGCGYVIPTRLSSDDAQVRARVYALVNGAGAAHGRARPDAGMGH